MEAHMHQAFAKELMDLYMGGKLTPVDAGQEANGFDLFTSIDEDIGFDPQVPVNQY